MSIVKGTNMSRNEANRIRLKALIELYDLEISAIAKTVGVSRPLVSRIVNQGIDGNGIWGELEKRLPELVAKRRKPFFDVAAIEVERVQKAVEVLKKVAWSPEA